MQHDRRLTQNARSTAILTQKVLTLMNKKVRKSHWLMGVSPLALAACGGGGDTEVGVAVVTGTTGADTFPNTSANERFEGGLGNDVYNVSLSGSDTVVDTGGNDTIKVVWRDEANVRQVEEIYAQGDDLVFDMIGAANVIVLEGAFADETRIENVQYYHAAGNWGDDYVAKIFKFGEEISADGSTDNLIVGTNDGEALTLLQGDIDEAAVYAAGGNDTITTGDGTQYLYGGNGDDILDGGDGNDFVYGGDGNDTVYMSPGADIEDGGDGIDTLILGDWAGDFSGTLNLETGANFAAGGSDSDAHKILNFENVTTQHSGDMTIYGTSGDNIITTGSGSDTVYAGAGNDTLTGNGGADTFVFIEGETGTDTITDFDLTEGDKLDLSSYGITTEEAAEALMSDGSDGVNVTIDGSLIVTMTGATVAGINAADGWLANAEANDNTTITPASHHSFTTSSGSYVLVAEQKTYVDAAAYARSELNGTLASFETQSEFDGFYSALQSTVTTNNLTLSTAPDGGSAEYIWLGATDSTTEGSWVWDSGVSLSYNDLWGSGALGSEPDNSGNQDGMAIGMENWPTGSATGAGYGDAGSWNDIDVSNTLYFVVEVA